MRKQIIFLAAQLTNSEVVRDEFAMPEATQNKVEVTMDLRPRVTKLIKAAKLSVTERRELTKLLTAAGLSLDTLRRDGHEFQAKSIEALCLRVDELFSLGMTENKA